MAKCIKLLQISDIHLFTDAKRTLAGLNTNTSFDAVLAKLTENSFHNADLILLTGDLIQDDLVSSYKVLAQKLAKVNKPIYWLPGNHDLEDIYHGAFSGKNIHDDKIIELGNWRLILLSTVQWGKVPGLLDSSQLDFLKSSLQQMSSAKLHSKHVLIALHHPPIDVNSRWLNSVGLININDFWQTIKDYPYVKGIIAGHVHQVIEQQYQGVQLLIAPSTCIQFTPHRDEFSLDPIQPGYRYLELYEDGSIVTEVYRLKNFELTLDLSIKGY